MQEKRGSTPLRHLHADAQTDDPNLDGILIGAACHRNVDNDSMPQLMFDWKLQCGPSAMLALVRTTIYTHVVERSHHH